MEIGDRLRVARERRGMTQGDLAAKLGVHVMTVTLWENRKARRRMGTKYIHRVAEILSIRVSELLGEESIEHPRASETPMIMTQTVDEVTMLRMYRLMSEKLKLTQLANFVECVGRSNVGQAISYDPTIDSATRQSTILGVVG